MRFKDFEIRPYKTGDDKAIYDKYEVIKWSVDKNNKSYCFVIAFIDYDEREPCWEFKSVGTRFLMFYEDGLSEFILKYLELLDVVKRYEEDDD